MEKRNLILLTGVPGSGKSTWVNSMFHLFKKPIIISRDEIRFSMVAENEEYFSKEKEVFKAFYKSIQEALDSPDFNNVFVDATHLSEASRNKVLDKLNLDNVTNLCVINFAPYLSTCLERNRQREGRACVPEDVITDMWMHYSPARHNEKYKYAHIWEVNDYGEFYTV